MKAHDVTRRRQYNLIEKKTLLGCTLVIIDPRYTADIRQCRLQKGLSRRCTHLDHSVTWTHDGVRDALLHSRGHFCMPRRLTRYCPLTSTLSPNYTVTTPSSIF